MAPRRRNMLVVSAAVFLLPHLWLMFRHADTGLAPTVRFLVLHSALLLVLDVVPIACIVGWYSWKERRNLWVEAVVLIGMTVGIQVLVRGIWGACIPEGERRARAGEVFEGPILFGMALLPVLSHLVMKRVSLRSWGFGRDVLLSTCGVVYVLVYELGLW